MQDLSNLTPDQADELLVTLAKRSADTLAELSALDGPTQHLQHGPRLVREVAETQAQLLALLACAAGVVDPGQAGSTSGTEAGQGAA